MRTLVSVFIAGRAKFFLCPSPQCRRPQLPQDRMCFQQYGRLPGSVPSLSRVSVGVLTAIALGVVLPLRATTYSLVDLGLLPGHAYSVAVGLNDSGQVIGTSFPSDAQGGHGRRRAFLFSAGRMIDLGVLTGVASEACGINASGQVVGLVETATGSRSFIHENGSTRDLLGANKPTPFVACGINDTGDVVGNVFSFQQTQSYIFSHGTLTSIGDIGGSSCTPKAINARGQVVGQALTRNGLTHAFVSEGGRMTDLGYLPGGFGYSVATAINNLGEIVGWSNVSEPGSGAVIYGNGAVVALGVVGGGRRAAASAINSAGVIVGTMGTVEAGLNHAMIFSGGRMLDLNSMLQGANGWVLLEAVAINDHGVIAATAFSPSGAMRAVLLTPGADSLPASPSRLTNLSIRSIAGTGGETLIVGFTLTGAGTKPVLVRGVGPTLTAFGVGGALSDPTLRLDRAGGGMVAQNEDWGNDPAIATASSRAGAFPLPPQSRDAALVPLLMQGSFTAQIGGVNRTDMALPGVALVELYDFSDGVLRFSNVSARTRVGSDADMLTAGFTISGDGVKTVLIRATGPALVPFGVSDTLSDPRLRIYNSTSTLIAENRDWAGPPLSAASASVGAFPLTVGSRDAALLVTLPPGSYTAQVSSQPEVATSSLTGIALIEVYELPLGVTW